MFFENLAGSVTSKSSSTIETLEYVVKGHEDLLRQVFADLLGRGEVRVRRRHGSITPWAREGGHRLIVEVRNLGPGFAYDDRERLFERGYRGASAKALVASGSGLGLYICREILDAAFGATIEAGRSAKKEETTFRIRFPHFVIDEEIRRLRRAARESSRCLSSTTNLSTSAGLKSSSRPSISPSCSHALSMRRSASFTATSSSSCWST